MLLDTFEVLKDVGVGVAGALLEDACHQFVEEFVDAVLFEVLFDAENLIFVLLRQSKVLGHFGAEFFLGVTSRHFAINY